MAHTLSLRVVGGVLEMDGNYASQLWRFYPGGGSSQPDTDPRRCVFGWEWGLFFDRAAAASGKMSDFVSFELPCPHRPARIPDWVFVTLEGKTWALPDAEFRVDSIPRDRQRSAPPTYVVAGLVVEADRFFGHSRPPLVSGEAKELFGRLVACAEWAAAHRQLRLLEASLRYPSRLGTWRYYRDRKERMWRLVGGLVPEAHLEALSRRSWRWERLHEHSQDLADWWDEVRAQPDPVAAQFQTLELLGW